MQDLDSKNYKKITAILIDLIISRPWFYINKKSKIYPMLESLKKLYSLYQDCILRYFF